MSRISGRSPRRHPDEHELVQVVEASAALRQLLAAASAPPSPAELTGRSRAIADFRAAQRPGGLHPPLVAPAMGEADPQRRAPARLARVGRWSAVRLTVACTALVVLLGGTAAAAAAGELPAALQNAVSDLLDTPPPAAPGPPAPDRSSAAPTVRPEPQRTGAEQSSAPDPAGSSTAGPPGTGAADPRQLGGLCRAYQAASSDGAAALLARPGFAPLVTAADGAPGVAAFCAQLMGPARTGPPGTRPSSTTRPGAHRGTATPSSSERSSAAVNARPVLASQPGHGWSHDRPQPRAGRAVTSGAPQPPRTAARTDHSDSGAPVERPNSRQ